MRQQFQPLFRYVFAALNANPEATVFDTLERNLDLSRFLLALNSEAFKNLVAGDLGRAFFEIGFGAVFFQVFVNLGQLGHKRYEALLEPGFKAVHVDHVRITVNIEFRTRPSNILR
jgi:hypothetical protein